MEKNLLLLLYVTPLSPLKSITLFMKSPTSSCLLHHRPLHDRGLDSLPSLRRIPSITTVHSPNCRPTCKHFSFSSGSHLHKTPRYLPHDIALPSKTFNCILHSHQKKPTTNFIYRNKKTIVWKNYISPVLDYSMGGSREYKNLDCEIKDTKVWISALLLTSYELLFSHV